MPNQQSITAPPIPRRRWRIAWLLGFGVLVNYFDRVNLSVSHAALVTSFGISAVTFGYLASAYNWTYALCQLPIGVILDKFGVRRVGRISIFVWSLASFAAALTPSIGGFFGARFLLGVGEASTFPSNAKAVGYWFPRHERSLATAICDAAAKLASGIGVPVIGLFLLWVGWRWSFALTGVISLVYLLLFWKIYRNPEDDPKLTTLERNYICEDAPMPIAANEKPASLTQLLSQRKVLGLALGFGSYNYVFYLLLTWLPSYFASALHIDLLHSFLYTGVPWLFATATDFFIGGWLADTLIQRGWNANRVRQVILIGGTACGLGILGAANAHTATRALIWISISIGGLAAAAPIGWSIPALIVPRSSVGSVGGIVNFSCQVSGIAAQIATGYMVAANHQSYAWVFVVAAIYLAIGIGGYIFLMGRIEPISLPANV
ncbi:MAG TPA: MFS transporter [Acidobacteriaceae bacterium]|nr:MFS transporter [Acidobacteriaceae bacterium]